MKSLRTFIAIKLPKQIREDLFNFVKELTAEKPQKGIRPVVPENIHLTLRFLGETPEVEIPKITTEIDKTAAHFRPFNLTISHFGGFPNMKRPRVIWAGVRGETRSLLRIQSQIEKAVQSFGWAKAKRRYKPHITLASIKNPIFPSKINPDLQIDESKFIVSNIYFIRSILKPEGPEYKILNKSTLSGDFPEV